MEADEGGMSALAFLNWKVGLQNRLIVEQEKRKHQERKLFKNNEDTKYQERKQALHKKVGEDFGNSKTTVDQIHEANRQRGLEYRQALEQMNKMVMHDREEWAQFGHELTIMHGTEQAERTKARIAEASEQKAEMGRQVRQEEQSWDKQVATQRHSWLAHAKEHVHTLKQDKIGKTDDAMRYALTQRKNKVASVQRTERRWKSLTKQERDAFLGHAHENHEKNDLTKDHMREARKELVRKNNQAYRDERQLKEDNAARIGEKKKEIGKAKRTARDKIFTERSVSADKLALYRELSRSPSPEKMAREAGLIIALPDEAPSPYKLP